MSGFNRNVPGWFVLLIFFVIGASFFARVGLGLSQTVVQSAIVGILVFAMGLSDRERPRAVLAEQTELLAEPVAAVPIQQTATETANAGRLNIVQCPACRIRVVPKSNGSCPSCQSPLV